MNRAGFLRVLNQDPKRWSSRHGVEAFTIECRFCGVDMVTSIPFAYGKLRGLIAPVCECGNDDTPYAIVGMMS